MKKNLLIAFLMCAGLLYVPAHNFVLSETGEEIRLYLGETQAMSVANPTKIAIGNPDIADVVRVTKKEITLSPKAVGETSLILWDNFGEQYYRVKVFAQNTRDFKQRIDNLLAKLDLKGVYTKEEDEEGKVFLTGEVNSAQDKDRIKLALGPLMDKAVDLINIKEEDTVVEIDVQVLELNKGSSQDLGFTYPDKISLTEVGSAGLTGAPWGSLFKVLGMKRDAYTMTINTLVREGKARILSRPRLACLSGKEAKLLVGGEVPILSATMTSGGGETPLATPGNVEYKEYGIKLNIKPRVGEDRRIHLNLEVEVSEVGETPVTTAYASAYPFTKRNVSTELFIDDGQTLAIGGLIKQKTEEDLRKFPWLADVPVLGAFFRERNTKQGGGVTARGDTELFITLTPRIVMGAKPVVKNAASIAPTPTQEEVFQEANIPENMLNYTKAVQIKIIRASYYPQIAKDAGWEGVVKLGLRIVADGGLQEAKVLKSSGYKILDDAALDVAVKQAPYPPFPPQIESQEISVEIPVLFKRD